MNAELKRKWVAALRSGEYRQTQEMLQSADKCFCCLGVLCEVTGRGFDGAYYDFGVNDEGEHLQADAELPTTAQSEFGLLDFHGRLIAMNDGDLDRGVKPLSFAEIADWIEQHIPEDAA